MKLHLFLQLDHWESIVIDILKYYDIMVILYFTLEWFNFYLAIIAMCAFAAHEGQYLSFNHLDIKRSKNKRIITLEEIENENYYITLVHMQVIKILIAIIFYQQIISIIGELSFWFIIASSIIVYLFFKIVHVIAHMDIPDESDEKNSE